ncbi:MAG: 5-deoxy-glucuronate isomerase [Acidimicrobiales bacterium]|nr:MAG: 5-deoxy-glucuronate isomerase [Acidimicrobiales bacterium]
MIEERQLHRPARSLANGTDACVLTPEEAGWTYSGLRIVRMSPGEVRSIETGGDEFAVLPLSGGTSAVTAEDTRYDLYGRDTVFARVTDWAYVPIETTMTIEATGDRPVELALCSARATQRFAPHYGAAEDVSVELRGGGQASRQINNFCSPEQFSGAEKLMVVEVYTPDGNWSSYPPHKHDDSPDCEVNNEEIYYFRIGDAGDTNYTETGFGMHRTYTGSGHEGLPEIDENVVVHDGDVFLIPRGYHGPCIAAPGYNMYYLNVLAGPGGERSMAFCDDPTHHWVRDDLSNQPMDARLPLMTSEGLS